MRLLKILLFILLLTSFASADHNFPYASISLKYPLSSDPFPGLGSDYCALSKGMDTAAWNPASIGKLSLSEAFVSMSQSSFGSVNRDTKVTEISDNYQSDGQTIGQYGIFFRYPNQISSGVNTEEVTITSNVNSSSYSTGTNFSSALKVNDWFSVGFATTNPYSGSLYLLGDMPTTTRLYTDLYGKSFNETTIASNGKLTYTYTSGSTVNTFETSASLWTGYLTQEVTIPFTTLTEFRNDINIDNPFFTTFAVNFKKLSVGLNVVPINASANINNNLRLVVADDTEDQFLYVPNFDSNDQTDIANWLQDQDKYGTAAGYKYKQIVVPAGEIVGNGEYRGFYNASAMRFDLGAMFDVSEWFTVGFSLENFGGANLNFQGNGIANYLSYRDINTGEASSLEDLFGPGGKSRLDLISDRWITTTEVNEYTLLLEPQKDFFLPKKIKYGFALKKPFLIVVDIEQNQNPINILLNNNDTGQMEEVTISNINYLRIGLESRLFFLPLWMRSGLALISKPSITNIDANTQSQIDNYFQYGYLPVGLDLGLETNMWGNIIGLSTKINPQIILSTLQLDTTNMELDKIVFGSLYYMRDPWTLTYMIQADPFASASAYDNRTVPIGETKVFEVSDLRYIQTLGVSYKF